METNPNTFAAVQQKKRQRRRVRTICVAIAVVLVVVIAAILLLPVIAADEASSSVLTYQVSAVSEGEIHTGVSGSGTLAARNAATYTAPADAVVAEVYARTGDRVSAGDTILTLTSDALDEELETLETELEEVNNSLAGASQEASSLYITAARAGVVKQLSATAGTVVEDAGTLCLISTDGRMRLVLEVPETVKKYDVVSVAVGEDAVEGLVTGLSDGTATIVIEDNSFAVGTAAAAYDADGGLLGTGTLALNEYIAVTGTAGRIGDVLVEENQSVSRGARLFLLEEGAPSATYLSLKEQQADLQDQIAECRAGYSVVAEADALVTSLPVAAGDELAAGETLCSLAGTDGYTMSVSVDELDIGAVEIGQEATITLDAIEGTFAGRVANLSYEGSGSYVTSYTATIEIDPIDGALPGMSASAEIITATTGQASIVPVDAVQYADGEPFVYLAPADASVGTVYAEDAVDLSSLSRVAVETGMSDGSYIAVTGELAAGDLILVPVRTTTATYESDDTQMMGGFGMGGMGSMGGMEMPADFGGGNRGGMAGGDRGGERPGA